MTLQGVRPKVVYIFFTIIGVIAPPAEKTNQRTDFQCTFDPEPFSCETPTRFVRQERTRTLLQYHDLGFVGFHTLRCAGINNNDNGCQFAYQYHCGGRGYCPPPLFFFLTRLLTTCRVTCLGAQAAVNQQKGNKYNNNELK